MKKTVFIVAGCVVLIGVVLLLAKERSKVDPSHVEGRNAADGHVVSQAARLPSGDESRRAGGGTGQGLQDAGGTIGQTGRPTPQVSDAVKALLGRDGKKHNYPSLLAAINELGEEISANDVAALREMLNFPNDRFPEKMRPIEINAVKNDVLDKLLRQKQLPEGLGLQMVEMANNPENDPGKGVSL